MNTHQYQYATDGMKLVIARESSSLSLHVGAKDHDLAKRLATLAIEDRKREIAMLQAYVSGETQQIL
jgi:hypothetical protein